MDRKRILLIQGHPDPTRRHLGHVLEDACKDGAWTGGHDVRRVEVATLEFALLRSQQEWEQGTIPPALLPAQRDITWANHLVLFFPLWLGDMPALLKGFLEQVARPGFAFKRGTDTPFGAKGLSGRSARVVATMGMPAAVYRWYFRAHSIKSLERNILGFVGISPVHETLVGSVEKLDAKALANWETALRQLGHDAL